MSKFIDSIYKFHNNPFILVPLFIEYFRCIKPKPNNILLAYLLLPLVLHEDSKKSLIKAKTTSSIHTFSNKNENFFGLQERIHQYKVVTNQCLQYAIDNKMLQVNENLIVEVLKTEFIIIENLKKSLKASKNLYKIYRDLDVVAIFRLMGVKAL